MSEKVFLHPMSTYDTEQKLICSLVLPRVDKAIEFYQKVFNAKENLRFTYEDKIIYVEMNIGNSKLMLTEVSDNYTKIDNCKQNISIYLCIETKETVDQILKNAMENGATTIRDIHYQRYGDNVYPIKDPFGIIWHVSNSIFNQQSVVKNTIIPILSVNQIDSAIDFYQKIYGTEMVNLYKNNDKIIGAELAIRDSKFILSESLDISSGSKIDNCNQITLYLYIPNMDSILDTVFYQAILEGSKMIYPIADQYYGDRAGTIIDPFGMIWTIATHIIDIPVEMVKERFRQIMQKGGFEEFYRQKYLKYKQKYGKLKSKA